MSPFYTMESVRDAILTSGAIDTVSNPGNFPSDWNYCPCVAVAHCEGNNTKACRISLGIFFNTPNTGRVVIEVIYLREKHTGFVRTNHMKLNELLDKGIIDRNVLVNVFV